MSHFSSTCVTWYSKENFLLPQQASAFTPPRPFFAVLITPIKYQIKTIQRLAKVRKGKGRVVVYSVGVQRSIIMKA